MGQEKHLEELNDETVLRRFVGAMDLLALDRVRPFWIELGLRFDRGDIVLGAIRAFMTAYRELEDAGDIDEDYLDLELVIGHARTLLTVVRLSEGDEAVETFWNWFDATYGNEPSWSWGWRILLYHWAELDLQQLVRWGFTADHARQALGVAEEWVQVVDDISARVSAAEQEPRRGWDADAERRFRKEMAAQVEAGGEAVGADLEISNEDSLAALTESLERRSFGRIWARLVRLITIPEMEVLMRWGRRKAEELEFEGIEIEGESAPEAEVPAEWRLQN